MRLKDKTALITGGNSGIGLETARLFVAEGAKVIITGRNQESLNAAANVLGPNAIALVADATDVAATEAAIAKGGSTHIHFGCGIAALCVEHLSEGFDRRVAMSGHEFGGDF